MTDTLTDTVSGGLDVIGVTGDPMSAISSAGVGWVLGAVSFLREPFDALLGNPDAITGSAQSWGSASDGLSTTAQDYRTATTTQTRGWTGAASDGYRAASGNQADGLTTLAQASRGVSEAMTKAGYALASARKTVLDLINEAVQKIIQICLEALSSSWLSFGSSIALGIAQSVQKAVQTAQRLLQQIKQLVSTLKQIIDTVRQIIKTAKEIKDLLSTIGGKASEEKPQQLSTTPVAASPDTNGLDPNNLGVAAADAQEIAPGFENREVRNVADAAPPAQGPVSQNGWPVNPPRGARTIPGTNVRVTVADGPAGDVLMHVLGQVHTRVEDISRNSDAGEADDWGYAQRNVRGSGDISNHASATAVDVNATRHALGARDTFSATQVAEIHRILGEVDNVVRWGGDYTGRRDEMHFEIVGSQEEVTRVADRLRGSNVR